MSKIVINNEEYTYKEVTQETGQIGDNRWFLFWGISWKKLDRPFLGVIHNLQLFDKCYVAKQIAKKNITPKPGHWFMFHNDCWYEIRVR